MTTAAISALPPATAWQTEQLRVTAFAVPGVPFDYSPWWKSLTGADPDDVIHQPKQNLHQERGKLDDQKAVLLQVQAHRIDWLLLAAEDVSPPGFSFLGSFPGTLEDFVALMGRWLPSCPTISRFALAGVLLQPQPDRSAGYVQLGKYLKGVSLDPASSDFSYQINRPRGSRTSIPDLRINRLTKWSVALLRGFAVSAHKETISVADIARESACRLEFDMNTDLDFKGPLPSETLSSLLDEFAALAREIAEKGDLP